MIPAYTGTQIRAAEAPLLEAGRGPELMNLAAHGLARHTAELLRRERGRVYGTRVAALVGTGNNGGDALFAMALLAKRGVACTAVLLGKNAHDAGLAAFRKAGGRVVDGRRTNGSGSRGDSRRWRAASTALDGVDLVIDAVLGTGAKGGVELPEIPGGALVVACDLPSGVDADTGDAPDSALRADLTVTFGALKTGLTVGKGHLLSGRIEVVDIGLRPHLGEPDLHVIESDDAMQAPPAAAAGRPQVHARRPGPGRGLGPVPRGRDPLGDGGGQHGPGDAAHDHARIGAPTVGASGAGSCRRRECRCPRPGVGRWPRDRRR